MSDPIIEAGRIASTGLSVQSARLRIIAENMANVNSTGMTPGSIPYQRKQITFQQIMGDSAQGEGVRVSQISTDKSPFVLKYEPGHPAADERGYVKYPNVNSIIEMADMREANRSYEANLQVVRQARDLMSQTIDLLRN